MKKSLHTVIIPPNRRMRLLLINVQVIHMCMFTIFLSTYVNTYVHMFVGTYVRMYTESAVW